MLDILTVTIALFAVIDMLGNVPLIIKLREENGEIQSLKGSIIAFCIMVTFLFVGKYLFMGIGIETYHFGLAGSFLLLYFGFRMVLGIEEKEKKEKKKINATIFPIAFPLIAGPGTLSTIMSMRSDFSDLEILAGIFINSVIVYLVLKSAKFISRKLGVVGITIMERFFGVILIAIGMKIFLTNLILSINQVLTMI